MSSSPPPDLAVLGAGSAGFAAAIRASELGARVALVGHGTIGGTCVNVGCVPSKTLIRAAEAVHHARAAARFAGVRGAASLEDWIALIAQKDELVASLRKAKYADLLGDYPGIAYYEGLARLTPHGVAMDGTELRPGKIVIATGARPAVPPIPGIETVPFLTSASAMALESRPRSLLVVGGGYVACELGQMFARLGVRVTIVTRSRLLPKAEPEISEALTGYLAEEGIEIRCGVVYRGVRATDRGVALTVRSAEGDTVLAAERLLVATGRQPNTEGLQLRESGVELTPPGAIKVDELMRTTRAGIYAAGDVTGQDLFVYMAAYGAKVATENALTGDRRRYDRTAMPSVIFTDPQVASVGLTEAEALERGLEVKMSRVPLSDVPRALAARDTRGLIKLVAERATSRLLGAHLLAPEGGDSIQTAALAIRQGLTVRDLADTIFPYLTTVEGVKLAAQAFDKDVSRLSCCAG